ncbi:hypothetical protein GCM10022243_34550 [Saccharothrix violaceirubra]|uniref:Cell division septum initiation protein DivIVA n=1 Tax=Saccharothrix violaceirubra TaxID=413306 RepID=A0A7W7T586_9PSEU|nr:DivIVA domain-containing protein [Saccharothrix violaceirubra]MBB4966506.1 cell division septum initiation protein DivIVA [Saccharothrix violaceirubra]
MNEELVPLRTDFDRSWPGFDRDQVRGYVQEIEADLRVLAADRDNAIARAESVAERLAQTRQENQRLRERLTRVCREPVDLEGATERARRVIELANAEAEEILARAEAVARRCVDAAQRDQEAHRRRHQTLLDQLESHRELSHREHRELMERARAEVDKLTRQAEARRRELDRTANRERERVSEDFDLAMSLRRAEALKALSDHVETTRARSARMLREAEERVAVLDRHRDRILDALGATTSVLVDVGPIPRPRAERTAVR